MVKVVIGKDEMIFKSKKDARIEMDALLADAKGKKKKGVEHVIAQLKSIQHHKAYMLVLNADETVEPYETEKPVTKVAEDVIDEEPAEDVVDEVVEEAV